MASLVAAAIVLSVLVLPGGGSGSGGAPTRPAIPAAGKGELMAFDPTTRRPASSVPLDFVPGPVALDEGSVWILDPSENRVVRVDAVTRQVQARIEVGSGPVGLAVGAGSIWVANASGSSVSRIDAGTNQVTKVIDLDFHPAQIAANDQAVWVAEKGISGPTADAGLATIEPATNRVIDSVRFHEAPACPPVLAAGATEGWAEDAFGKLRELNPSGGEAVPVASSEKGFAGVVVDDNEGVVWFGGDGSPGEVVSLDTSTNELSGPIPVGTTQDRTGPGCVPIWLTLGGSYLWVTNADDQSVSVIATVSRQGVDRIHLDGKPSGLAFGVDAVWVAVDLP
jgi:YVTN family beta-propeller protein